MKTIRSLTTLAGLSLALVALSAAGAKAQTLYSTQFAGTFTLPFEAQWGKMTLPAGDYTLYYGSLGGSGYAVEVTGKAEGSPQGVILAEPADQSSATKNSIVCIREGNALIVRALELHAIGKSVGFQLPRGMKLMANKQNHNGYTQLAQAPMLIQRIPVMLKQK